MIYRGAKENGRDTKGPTTAMEKLRAWWNHGELKYPRAVAVACIVGILCAVLPKLWLTLHIVLLSLTLVAGIGAGGTSLCLLTSNVEREDRVFFRKTIMFSVPMFSVFLLLLNLVAPYAAAEKIERAQKREAQWQAEHEKAQAQKEEECRALLSLPGPSASCPTDMGGC